jgi:hypothetical protein
VDEIAAAINAAFEREELASPRFLVAEPSAGAGLA